jgi:hypothetical protein
MMARPNCNFAPLLQVGSYNTQANSLYIYIYIIKASLCSALSLMVLSLEVIFIHLHYMLLLFFFFFKLIIFHHLKYYTIHLYLFTHSYYSACCLIQVFIAKY